LRVHCFLSGLKELLGRGDWRDVQSKILTFLTEKSRVKKELVGDSHAFGWGIVIYTLMNCAAVIEHIKTTQETLSKLLALLESSEADRFVAHLYQARKHYRLICKRPNKGSKTIERNHRKIPSRAEPRIHR
jgi:hypothetical protein